MAIPEPLHPVARTLEQPGGGLSSYPPVDRWEDWEEYDPRAWPRKETRRYQLIPTICFNCEAACGLLAYVDRDRMAKLRATYLRDATETCRREAAIAAREGDAAGRLEWQARLEEMERLDERLAAVQEGRIERGEGDTGDLRILTPWKLPEERPRGWDPDLDDGVKVNIGPLERAGALRVAGVA